MGHREVKRVPLDFGWPQGEIWEGYLRPDSLSETPCEACRYGNPYGTGYSPQAQHLHNLWYGNEPFDPVTTGSTRLTSDTPAVRRFAERNVANSPDYYGTGERAVAREGHRLADLWNGMWCHHLNQDDVNALCAGGRLMDFTHTWSREEGWQPKEPPVIPAAEQVNEWSLSGFGHHSINAWIAIKARCKREGYGYTCPACSGHGSFEAYEGQRAEAEKWERTEPPAGDGWQLWETTTEGSPCSPVFESAEELAVWCETGATPFGSMEWTREEWLAAFRSGTTDTDTLLVGGPGGVRMLGPDQ